MAFIYSLTKTKISYVVREVTSSRMDVIVKCDEPDDGSVDYEGITEIYFRDKTDDGDEKKEYKSTDELLNEMNEKLVKFLDVYMVSKTKIRIVIDEFKWNTHKFYEEVFDGEIIKKIIFNVFNISDEINEICYNETCSHCSDKPTSSLLCRHKFCDECITQYISSQIKLFSPRRFVTCPCCDYILEDEFVIQQLSIEDKYVYKRVILGKYSENKSIMFCPRIGCYLILKSKNMDKICECGFSFCIKCGSEVHEPITCQMMEAWKNLQIELSKQRLSAEAIALKCRYNGRCKRLGITNVGDEMIEATPERKLFIINSEKYFDYQRRLEYFEEFTKLNRELFVNSAFITKSFLENINACYATILTGFMFACFEIEDRNMFMIMLTELVKTTERLTEILENAVFGTEESDEKLLVEISEKYL